jgi:hypothetical protein
MLENTRSVNTGMTRLFVPARNPEIPQLKQAISAKPTACIAHLFGHHQSGLKSTSLSNFFLDKAFHIVYVILKAYT